MTGVQTCALPISKRVSVAFALVLSTAQAAPINPASIHSGRINIPAVNASNALEGKSMSKDSLMPTEANSLEPSTKMGILDGFLANTEIKPVTVSKIVDIIITPVVTSPKRMRVLLSRSSKTAIVNPKKSTGYRE